jgi:hypothetical protein
VLYVGFRIGAASRLVRNDGAPNPGQP